MVNAAVTAAFWAASLIYIKINSFYPRLFSAGQTGASSVNLKIKTQMISLTSKYKRQQRKMCNSWGWIQYKGDCLRVSYREK